VRVQVHKHASLLRWLGQRSLPPASPSLPLLHTTSAPVFSSTTPPPPATDVLAMPHHLFLPAYSIFWQLLLANPRALTLMAPFEQHVALKAKADAEGRV